MVKKGKIWGFTLLVLMLASVKYATGIELGEKSRSATSSAPVETLRAEEAFDVFLPLLLGPEAEKALCRYGVNYASSASGDNPANYDLTALYIGWYLNYSANASSGVPEAIKHSAIISLSQTDYVNYTYATSPPAATIQQLAAANPGKTWYIGNEPDRVVYQNDLEPHVYAEAYHDLYHLLKAADPTAVVVAGTIVQATPVRLTYLDMVLDHYQTTYGEAMPVDAWSIHGFILNEVSCDYDLSNCWGAEIPQGVDVGVGEIVTIEDNDNYDLFVERIVRFRSWMAERGYRNTPLYMSEFGILMPAEYGFDAARVNRFMDRTFTYMQNATDPALGYHYDGNRLVQRWAWYSVADALNFNGWLYSPVSKALSPMGANFAAFTAAVEEETDLYPARVTAPAVRYDGSPATVTLYATIANSGNRQAATRPVSVRFYDSNDQQIGSTQNVTLRGCGDHATVSVSWADRDAGTHAYYVIVDGDGAVTETNEHNNRLDGQALVATGQVGLPLVSR
ncbi:MAG: CARDB domain-containing protein [Anaerolineae bacterium]|nr:CARDB domain-containing protein [Anaerolineae bacterium]